MSMAELNPYSNWRIVEGFFKVGTAQIEGAINHAVQSPKKWKKVANSSMKVNIGDKVGEGRPNEVKGHVKLESLIATKRREQEKSVIFNIHRTLLDCSLKLERNPNSSIRPTMKTSTRRVVFILWLLQFLSRCFINFTMVFWDSKSECYMDEIVLVVLEQLKDGQTIDLLSIW
jgi:hypothetical protein